MNDIKVKVIENQDTIEFPKHIEELIERLQGSVDSINQIINNSICQLRSEYNLEVEKSKSQGGNKSGEFFTDNF